mgnify:CR=1 FL=1
MSGGVGLLAFGVFGEGVGVEVLVVGGERLLAGALPESRINSREERVGILPRMVDMRHIELVHTVDELRIDIATTNDEDFI